MAFTAVPRWEWSGGGDRLSHSKSYSADNRVSLDFAVPDASTDLEVALTLDVSEIKAIFIVSDQDITLETNNGGTPVDTIALKANVPYVWTTDTYDTLKLATDVTASFWTNASGSTANVRIEAIVDPTP